jgi:hypothetical protein
MRLRQMIRGGTFGELHGSFPPQAGQRRANKMSGVSPARARVDTDISPEGRARAASWRAMLARITSCDGKFLSETDTTGATLYSFPWEDNLCK